MKELVSAESNKERDVYAWDAAADWRQIRAFDFFQKTFWRLCLGLQVGRT